MNKTHIIKDNKTGKQVGYTKDGTLGRLMIFLNEPTPDHFVCEIESFAYFCTLYGYDYTLEEFSETSTSDFPTRLYAAYKEACSDIMNYWSNTSAVPTAIDMQKFFYRACSKFVLSHAIDTINVTGYGTPRAHGTIVYEFASHFRIVLDVPLSGDEVVAMQSLFVDVSDFYYYKATNVLEFRKTFVYTV